MIWTLDRLEGGVRDGYPRGRYPRGRRAEIRSRDNNQAYDVVYVTIVCICGGLVWCGWDPVVRLASSSTALTIPVVSRPRVGTQGNHYQPC